MSLWTPSGEHPVDPRQGASAGEPGPSPVDEPSFEDLTPEQRAQAQAMAEQMAEARARVLEAPVGVVVAQNALAFYELAGLYLSQEPPRLDDARVAIDALKAVAEALDDRLGDAHQPIQQALNQAQMAYVAATDAS
jgi:hypothetical protein